MTNFLQFVLALIIIIVGAKTGGYISTRWKQPAVLGELLAGLVLGPTVLNMLHWGVFSDGHLGEFIGHLAEFGVILLMLLAGLELHINELAKSSKVAALAGTLGVATPVLMGWGVCILFGLSTRQAMFVGLILAATSVSISAQTLMELGLLRSRVGVAMLGAAVFDDVLVLLALSVFTALTGDMGAAGVGEVLQVLLQMVGYFATSIAIGIWLLPRLANRVDRLHINQGLYLFTLIIGLLYAWAAEALGGIAAITGAFLAGLLLSRTSQRERTIEGVSTIAYSLFVPVFFANIGLQTNARNLSGGLLWMTLAIIVVAVASKLLGCGLGARIGGMSPRQSLQLGAGMISRGEVGLIVATLGLTHHLISQEIFSMTVVTVIVVTLLTPILLHRLAADSEPAMATEPALAPE